MKYKKLIGILLCITVLQSSCKKYLEIEPPKDSLVQSSIFQNDDSAIAAITGIYSRMSTIGYASGSSTSISSLAGLSSDEYISYNVGLNDYYLNQLNPLSTNLDGLYSVPYQNIFAVNAILEGLATSSNITTKTKEQLIGEAHFIRAFIYFYLVNLFGPVPIALSTDYRINQVLTRSTVSDVYKLIIDDLKISEGLISDTYVSNERVRPNKSTILAMLARVYLYTQNWDNAEKYSSLIISNSNLYKLVNLEEVFLKNSNEAIWQLMPPSNTNTQDGNLLILNAIPTNVSLQPNFALNSFETNDRRKLVWIKSFTSGNNTYYFTYKYKVKSSTVVSEYSMILRLAEQYLIRSEARTQLNNLSGAIDDLDIIRERAGISLIKNINPGINKHDLLVRILKERQVELFSEWGHRWLDLKRTNTANEVLVTNKPSWQLTDLYYPIPQNEISRNQNILQNPGY